MAIEGNIHDGKTLQWYLSHRERTLSSHHL